MPTKIEGIVQQIKNKQIEQPNIAYWCQDETRIGFRTESGKKITLKGVKPILVLQWHYDYYYIYGAECARRQALDFKSREPAGLIEPSAGRSCLGRATRS